MTHDEFWEQTEPGDYRTVEYISYFGGEIKTVSGPVRHGIRRDYLIIESEGIHEPNAVDYAIVRRVG